MSVTVQASKHPLKAEWVYADVEPGQSIYEIAGGAPVAAYINGREVPEAFHRLTQPKDESTLVLWPVPQDDDVTRAVVSIGIAIAAPYAAAAIGFTAGTTAFAVATASIAAVGNMALNSLIPPQVPDRGSDSESFNRLESITGQSNRVASFSPIPRMYGVFRYFPSIPMTAKPYTEIEGGDQYLRMFLCLGHGPLQINNTSVGGPEDDVFYRKISEGTFEYRRTPNSFANIPGDRFYGDRKRYWRFQSPFSGKLEYRFRIGGGGDADDNGGIDIKINGTLVESNVGTFFRKDISTVSGQVSNLQDGENVIEITSSYPGSGIVKEIYIEAQIDENISDDVRIGETDITSFEEVEYEIGRPDQITIYSDQVIEESIGFQANEDNDFAVRTTEPDTDEIGIDVGGRLFSANDKGKTRFAAVNFRIEYREVGSEDWLVENEDWVLRSSKKETVRQGYRWPVAKGQYEVRLTRKSSSFGGGNAKTSTLAWGSLRSIRSVQPFAVEDTVCMALRIKATDQLNGRIEDLSVLATSVLDVYDGSQWTKQATNNPAWVFADIWSGTANRQPVGKDGLDADALLEWANYCDQEGLEYNGVFDSSGTTLDRAQEVAGAGLASWQFTPDSKISIVRDVVQSVPKMVISPRNSFGFNYELSVPQIPDALRVQFVDDRTWENTERLVFDDGFDETNAELYETLQAKGVTNPDQAWKYGRYHIAQQRLRPERYNFSQDVQHLRYQRGDLLTLQHDVIAVGLGAGRIKEVVSDTEIVVDEVFADQGITNYGVKIQHQDGSVSVVGCTLGSGPTNNTVFLDSAITKTNPDDLVIFGELGKESTDVKVTEIQPQGDFQAQITCVPAAPEIEQVWDGDIPAFDPVLTEPVSPDQTTPRVPSISDIRSDESVLYADDDGSLKVRMVVSTFLDAFPGWDQKTQLRFRPVGDTSFETLEPTRSNSISVTDVDEGIEYEVQARGVKNGIFSVWGDAVTHTVTGKSNPPPDVSVFSATQNGINVDFDWDAVIAPDLDGYVIRVGGLSDNFDSASKLLSTNMLSTEAVTQLPAGTYRFFIKAEDTTENLSTNAAQETVTVLPPQKVSDFIATQNGIRVNFNWSPISYFGLDGYEIRIGSTSDNWQTAEKLIDVGALSTSGFELVEPGQYRFFIKAYSSLGDESEEASSFDLTVEPPERVENFNTIQNGETVVFRWNPVDFFGLKGYEIRYGDPDTVTWPSGSKIVEANQSTAIAQADVPPGEYKFMIKAISDLESESQEPNERVFRVKTDYIERERTVHHPNWSDGWYRGFEKQGDVLVVEDNFEGFYVTDEVDLLFDAESVRAWGVLEAALSDSEQSQDNGVITQGLTSFKDYNGIGVTATEEIDNGLLQVGLPLSNPFVSQEIATRNTSELWQDAERTIERYEGVTSPATQTEQFGSITEDTEDFESYDTLMGWRSWTRGELDARFVKYRARITRRTEEDSTKLLRKFTTVVDVDERIERQQNKAVAVGGTTFSFDRTFHFLPAVVATVESNDALFPIRKDLNTDEVTFVVRDAAGNDVGTDNLDFIATGA